MAELQLQKSRAGDRVETKRVIFAGIFLLVLPLVGLQPDSGPLQELVSAHADSLRRARSSSQMSQSELAVWGRKRRTKRLIWHWWGQVKGAWRVGPPSEALYLTPSFSNFGSDRMKAAPMSTLRAPARTRQGPSLLAD